MSLDLSLGQVLDLMGFLISLGQLLVVSLLAGFACHFISQLFVVRLEDIIDEELDRCDDKNCANQAIEKDLSLLAWNVEEK